MKVCVPVLVRTRVIFDADAVIVIFRRIKFQVCAIYLVSAYVELFPHTFYAFITVVVSSLTRT